MLDFYLLNTAYAAMLTIDKMHPIEITISEEISVNPF